MRFSKANPSINEERVICQARVRGDSMDKAGILEGDLVQVRRQDHAEAGEIVVAVLEEEGVIKRLAKNGSSWQLESANTTYSPITEKFTLMGEVFGDTNSDRSSDELPLEFLVAFTYDLPGSLTFDFGAGGGLGNDKASPDLRITSGISHSYSF